MTRLIDELDPNDPEQAHAALLLQAGGPLPESEVSRQRVLRALERRHSRAPGRRLRPTLAAAVLLGLAGTAGAAFGIARWVSPSEEVAGKTPDRASPADATKSASAPKPRNESTPDRLSDAGKQATEFSAAEKARPASEASELDRDGVEFPHGTSSPKSSAPQKRSAAKEVEPTAKDTLLLHQVVKALRSSNDPEKAARLLREYEGARPSGALEEEVLALKIETALANQDPKAQELARRYLARYPRGRFRRLATKAVSQGK